jgi:hypothetical protein
MKCIKYTIALFAVLALTTAANATTVWNFAGTSLQNNGYSPTPTGGTGTISVYAFQLDDNGNLLTTPVTNANHGGGGTSTLNGLFQVTNGDPNDEGSGIAPYNPTEGGAPFSNQDGITDDVANVGPQFHNGPYNNFLELQLSSNIPVGTTLTFLMEHGNGDGSAPAFVDVYTDNNALVGSGIAPENMTLADSKVQINTIGQANPGGTFTITATGKNEVVAIVADCHYLLLDTITGTTVPEPRFYGVLLAGLLGLVGIFVHNRRRVTA